VYHKTVASPAKRKQYETDFLLDNRPHFAVMGEKYKSEEPTSEERYMDTNQTKIIMPASPGIKFWSDKEMKTYIALFRGINVGGKHILPMKDLTALLENIGAQGVKTYIQSGNAVFEHRSENVAELSDRIKAAINKSHGVEPRVLLLDVVEMKQAIAANPFPEAESDPKTLHLYFLADPPQNPDLNRLDQLKRDNEHYHLSNKIFYLHAPDGIGRSKLAEQVEKALGVAATARNWRTVGKVMALTEQQG
jgi:uncharacterized protein (DUF1697 family)